MVTLYIAVAYIVAAYIVVAYIVVANIGVAYIVMPCIGMAYIVIAIEAIEARGCAGLDGEHLRLKAH